MTAGEQPHDEYLRIYVFAGRWLVLRPSDARSSSRWTLTRQCAANACNRLRTWAFTCCFDDWHDAVRWWLDGSPLSTKPTQKQRGTTLCGRPSMPTVAGSSHRVSRWLDNNRRGETCDHARLVLEEKEIVAQQAKKRQGKRTDLAPYLAQSSEQGRTLEILARDIPMGREQFIAGHSSGRGFYARRLVRAP